MGKRVILITGADAEIGKEAALQLADAGHVVYAGVRSMDEADTELAPYGVTPVAVDITKPDDNERVVKQVVADQGRIDVLMCNSDYGLYGPVEDVDVADAQNMFNVSLFGMADLVQRVLPLMRAQQAGRTILGSTMTGGKVTPCGAWHAAVQSALHSWASSLRMETAVFDIYVDTVHPGLLKTDAGDSTLAQLKKFQGQSAYGHMLDLMVSNLEDSPQPTDCFHSPAFRAQRLVKTAQKPFRRERQEAAQGKSPLSTVRRWATSRLRGYGR